MKEGIIIITVVAKFSFFSGISQRFLGQVPFGGAVTRMSFLDRSNSGGGLDLTTTVSLVFGGGGKSPWKLSQPLLVLFFWNLPQIR